MALQLVEQWLTEAAMFTADGETVIPGELLYKKPVLLERGSFRPLTNPMLDMLERAQEHVRPGTSAAGRTARRHVRDDAAPVAGRRRD